MVKTKRLRGAQPGNCNARKHGRTTRKARAFTRAMSLFHRQCVATLESLAEWDPDPAEFELKTQEAKFLQDLQKKQCESSPWTLKHTSTENTV